MKIFKSKNNKTTYFNEKLPSKRKLLNIIKNKLYEKFFDFENLEEKCETYKNNYAKINEKIKKLKKTTEMNNSKGRRINSEFMDKKPR